MRLETSWNDPWVSGRFWACSLVVYLAAVMPVIAASPGLGAITPTGGQRGTEVEVTFSGSQLADAQQVLLYWPGIEVVQFEPASDGAWKTRLKIAPDCPLGAHPMRVRTATGISNLRTWSVGTLTEAAEVEPNNDFAAPQAIGLDSCISGVVENEDVDYYVVDVTQGQRLTAEVEAIRLGNFFFDAYVAIMDQGRFELSSSDDAALVWQDGVASIVAPETGKYVVQVRDSSFGGNGACTYRLHVGRFPRPRAVVPAGGRWGENLDVIWLGDVAGERRETVSLPNELRGDFSLVAHDDQGTSPFGSVFRLGELANVLETEPNNSAAEATIASVPAALGGVIATSGDVDWFRFTGTKGQVLDLRVWARGIRSPLDPVLTVYRADQAALAGNDDSGGPDSYLRFTVPDDGDYLTSIQDHLGQGGAEYAYRLEIAPVKAQLTMGLPERSQFVDMLAPIPRGNRLAILVSAARADFGGELSVDVAGLPPGVTLETVNMPANQTTTPVLFTATADAALAGALVDVVGRSTDPNLPVKGHLLQTTSMVRGQNNIHVWDVNTTRMALAVTEVAGATIELVEPKAPLVQNGVMDLKVVAHRALGYTAAIPVRLLYNPPGVGSSASVVIPEGQSEALIPLNADGSAELKTWKIAVIGDAPAAGGVIPISTQLANLRIAPPFVSLAFQAAAVEKGQETDVVISVTKNQDFAGPARIELLGLPNEVTTVPLEFGPDATELVFRVKTTANSPAGKHPTLLCRAVITTEGEPVTHMQGSGELRIDEPLPPKPMETVAAAPPPPVAEAPPTEKRLTLLEKLRLERRQRKAARAAAEAAANATLAPASETTVPTSGGN